jgi:ParB family chromosome partitioning protein
MAKLTDSIKGAGMNSGATVLARLMRVADIQTDPTISGIFPLQEEILAAIVKSMRESGYDKAEPVVIWKGKNVVVDGHTRLKAAIEAGIPEIPVEEKEFASLDEAVRYTYKRQADRRNLTQAEIFAAATRLQNKTKQDGLGRGSEQLAKELGISAATIQHARKVASDAPPEIIDQVKKNKLSINKAYNLTKKEKPTPEFKTSLPETGLIRVESWIQGDHLSIAEQNPDCKEAFQAAFTALYSFVETNQISIDLFHDTEALLKPLLGEQNMAPPLKEGESEDLGDPDILGAFIEP